MSFGIIKLRKTDKLFRQYVLRVFDYTCARCRKTYEPDNCQGLHVSHFWGRARENTRFDIDNVDLLCFGCHQIWGHGDGRKEYIDFMLKKLGQEGLDRLEIRAYTYKKRDDILDKLCIRELLKGL